MIDPSAGNRNFHPCLWVTTLGMIVCFVLLGPVSAVDAQTGYWPNGAQGAVSLTFDDAMPSQLERAVPVLDRWGFKASFYLTPSYALDWETNKSRWRQLAIDGHEIGNHTDRH